MFLSLKALTVVAINLRLLNLSEKQFILFCKAKHVNKLYLNDCLLTFPSGQVPILPITNRTPLKL